MHINLVEVDAVVRGISLALKWQLKKILVVTDSTTVFSWVQSVLTGSHRIKPRGMAEMLVRRRFSVVKMLVEEYKLTLKVEWVASPENKADVLTRVRRRWIANDEEADVGNRCEEVMCSCLSTGSGSTTSTISDLVTSGNLRRGKTTVLSTPK